VRNEISHFSSPSTSLKVDFQGSRVTSDGGLILVRELDERLGFSELIGQNLTDSRGKNTHLPLADLSRQSIYSRMVGYEDVNDAERLSQDPAFRLIGFGEDPEARGSTDLTIAVVRDRTMPKWKSQRNRIPMDIKELKKYWNRLGKADPLWAILAQPDKKGNRWQRDEFFLTGEREVATVMDYVGSLGINLRRSRALDFGCGVGRLTQALANYSTEVCGVDIAPSMIRLAERYNRHARNCKYYLNDRADLKFFDDASFDFIYTSLTLQHIEPAYTKAYLKEFLRLLVPEGILVFNLPSERISPPGAPGGAREASNGQPEKPKADEHKFANIKRFIKSLTPGPILDFYLRLQYPDPPIMEMHAIKREELERFLVLNGARILGVVESQAAGPGWISYRYCATKLISS
jgi:ubiquinone/menaquinone biosynthesis C-methylase UbiE